MVVVDLVAVWILLLGVCVLWLFGLRIAWLVCAFGGLVICAFVSFGGLGLLGWFG